MAGKKDSWFVRIKKRFSSDKLSKKLKKVKDLSDSELHKEDLRKKLFTDHSTKKKQSYSHVRTEKLLRKAGLDADVWAYRKALFRLSVVLCIAATFAVLTIAVLAGQDYVDVLIFLAGLWTAGFLGVWLLVQLSSAFILDLRIDKRRKEVERVLPDFLQLTAANIGAGMPIDRALWYAVRPRFGVLANEIETVAKHVLTGEELEEALMNFTKQYDSPLLTRSINLLLEGVAAGGHVADLLHKISVDIQEQRIIQQELSANIMTYVIFISFAAVLAAPVLFGLATQLLIVIQSIAQGIGAGGSSTAGFTISPDVVSLRDFRIFAISLLVGSSIISSLIIGVIRKGDAKEGLRFTAGFIVVSVALYLLSTAFFATLFGGLV